MIDHRMLKMTLPQCKETQVPHLVLVIVIDLYGIPIPFPAYLLQGADLEIFSYKPVPLNSKTLEKIRPVLDYRCMVSGSEQKFLLGLGVSGDNRMRSRRNKRQFVSKTEPDLQSHLVHCCCCGVGMLLFLGSCAMVVLLCVDLLCSPFSIMI